MKHMETICCVFMAYRLPVRDATSQCLPVNLGFNRSILVNKDVEKVINSTKRCLHFMNNIIFPNKKLHVPL